MWQSIKVWVLRKYYRFISAHRWKGHPLAVTWAGMEIPSPEGTLHCRLYTAPEASSDKPLIVYFHGGGWVIGGTDTHNTLCSLLSERSGCTVISVDYRLAPEHPFPAALEDCLQATRWIAGHAGDFGPSNHRLVIAGDSAGGNLATLTCLELDGPAREAIVAQVPIYPVTDYYDAGFPSYVERATGQTLTTKLMVWFWDTYLADCTADRAGERAFPLRSERLGSLPPTFLVTAEHDPLRDEGRALGDKLQAAGVVLQYRHFDRAAHGFASSEGHNEHFEAMMGDLVPWLDQFSGPAPTQMG